jgi:hypothetical protein
MWNLVKVGIDHPQITITR